MKSEILIVSNVKHSPIQYLCPISNHKTNTMQKVSMPRHSGENEWEVFQFSSEYWIWTKIISVGEKYANVDRIKSYLFANQIKLVYTVFGICKSMIQLKEYLEIIDLPLMDKLGFERINDFVAFSKKLKK